MSKPMSVSAVGMPWYSAENYGRILDVMEDAAKLPATFEDWLKAAELGFRRLTGEGHVVVRAEIDADEFVGWCRSKGLNVDSHARNQFAAEAAMLAVKNMQ